MGNDALSEVLLRVDPENIVKFLVISKEWLEAIKEPSFRKAYQKKWSSDELVGFLVEDLHLLISRTVRRSPRWLHEPQPLPPAVQLLPTSEFGSMLNRKKLMPENLGFFIAKSNGIILSGVHPKRYHVFEPLKRRVDRLPRPAKRCPHVAIAVISRDAVYEVIQAKVEKVEKKSLFYQTYSSATGTWAKSRATCSSRFSVRTNDVGIVTRAGWVFWMAFTRHWLPCIAAFDTKSAIDEPARIHLLKPPFPHTGSKNLTRSDFDSDPEADYHYVGKSEFYSESPDGYLRCATCCTSVINIWVLDRHDFNQEPDFDDSEDFEEMEGGDPAGWSLVYVIDLEEMWVNNSKLPLGLNSKLPFFFVSFLDGKWDIYVRWKELIFLYHLETGNLEWVPYYLDDGGYQFPEKNPLRRRFILHPLTMTELGAWP